MELTIYFLRNVEFKNEWNSTSTLYMPSWLEQWSHVLLKQWCLIFKRKLLRSLQDPTVFKKMIDLTVRACKYMHIHITMHLNILFPV